MDNSHYPILAACTAGTEGPILELGCGEGSTPMLHYIAIMQNREILSVDSDPTWLEKYSAYRCPRHQFQLVPPSTDATLCLQYQREKAWREWRGAESRERWGLAFIDCAPGEIRWELMIRLANRATVLVAHDSETDYKAGGNYQYAKALPSFKYVAEWRRWRPYTLIGSNYAQTFIEECDKIWRQTCS